MLIFDFYFQLVPNKTEEETEGAEEEETLEKWRLARMEKEKWMQEFEKKQSRKRGYEEEEEDVAGEIENDSQFFQMAEKTLMRMTSKDDTVVNFPDVTCNRKCGQRETMFDLSYPRPLPELSIRSHQFNRSLTLKCGW